MSSNIFGKFLFINFPVRSCRPGQAGRQVTHYRGIKWKSESGPSIPTITTTSTSTATPARGGGQSRYSPPLLFLHQFTHHRFAFPRLRGNTAPGSKSASATMADASLINYHQDCTPVASQRLGTVVSLRDEDEGQADPHSPSCPRPSSKAARHQSSTTQPLTTTTLTTTTTTSTLIGARILPSVNSFLPQPSQTPPVFTPALFAAMYTVNATFPLHPNQPQSPPTPKPMPEEEAISLIARRAAPLTALSKSNDISILQYARGDASSFGHGMPQP